MKTTAVETQSRQTDDLTRLVESRLLTALSDFPIFEAEQMFRIPLGPYLENIEHRLLVAIFIT